jgi:hypothetical protein
VTSSDIINGIYLLDKLKTDGSTISLKLGLCISSSLMSLEKAITVKINLPTWVYPWLVLIGRPLLLVVFGRILLRIGKVSVLAWSPSFVFHSVFNIFSTFIKEIMTIDKHWNHLKIYNFVSKQHAYNAPTKLSRIFSRDINN